MGLDVDAPLIKYDTINLSIGGFVMYVHDTLEPIAEFPELTEPKIFIPIVIHIPSPERWWQKVMRVLNMDVRDVWRLVKAYWRH